MNNKVNPTKVKKILLVNPPGSLFMQSDGTRQTKELYLPIHLACLAASARQLAPFEIKIFDMVVEDYDREVQFSSDTVLYGASFEQYWDVLRSFQPDLVGVACLLSSRSRFTIKLLQMAKEWNREVITVSGGHHATAMPEHILGGGADYVFLGESDHSFVNFLRAVNADGDLSAVDGLVYKDKGSRQIITQNKTNYVKDIDSLPYPAWDIVNLEKYWNRGLVWNSPTTKESFVLVMSSRGCPHVCSYCAVPRHTGERNYRSRPIESVVAEIRWLIETFGVKEVHFADDNFFVNKNRTKKLLRRLISEFPGIKYAFNAGTDLPNIDFEIIDLLKEAGVKGLLLGIETGADENVGKFIDKRLVMEDTITKIKYLEKLGIETYGMFLLGFPGETPEQVKKTVALAESLPLDNFYLIMVTPLPGSELYDYCVKNDLLYSDFDITKVRFSNTFIKNENISRHELEGIRKTVWEKHFGGRENTRVSPVKKLSK